MPYSKPDKIEAKGEMPACKRCFASRQNTVKKEAKSILAYGDHKIYITAPCKGKDDNSNYWTSLKHSEIIRRLDEFPDTRCVQKLISVNGMFMRMY
jgi:hypothetical protein